MVTTITDLTTEYRSGRPGDISLIGIHTAEAPENENVATAVANYFKSVEASSHWVVDDKTRVRVVWDQDTAWTMPPCNEYSLNVEMAGYAAQSNSQWDDAYSLAVLDNAAVCCAEWCIKYDIPVRRLTDSQIADREKGLAGHVDINRVFQQGDHVDPGPNFPWDKFLGMINTHLGKPSGSTTAPASGKPNCTIFQKAIRTTADNSWGPATDKNATAMIEASAFGDYSFPYGVAFAQSVVGAKQDGQWGLLSKNALAATVKSAQSALKAMGYNPGTIDGDWGVNSNKAYASARSACHI